MKAIVLEKAGGVENLVMQEVAQPQINNNEVLVKVKAISLNPADTKAKYSDEMLNMIFGPDRPLILGWDVAGIIVSVGDEVSDFRIGDKVFGMVNFPGVGNAYAEYVASPAEHLAIMPEDSGYEEAAATTLAALTALQVLTAGNVKKDDRVLVHAGSGGVGHFAIQIAKNLGAHVVSTSSAKNRDFILGLGADEHIDYRSQKFEELLSDIDFVFDTIGGENIDKSMTVLKQGGQLISIAMMGLSDELKAKSEALKVTVSPFLVKSSGNDMNALKGMLEKGQITPTVAKSFPFTAMKEAHTEVEKGRTVGKVIVTI